MSATVKTNAAGSKTIAAWRLLPRRSSAAPIPNAAAAAGMKIGVSKTKSSPTITSDRSRSSFVGRARSATEPV